MKCLACNGKIDWWRPIIYMGFNEAVHVDEFLKYLETHTVVRLELDKKRRLDERNQG